MKKTIHCVLFLFMILALAACDQGGSPASTQEMQIGTDATSVDAPAATEAPVDGSLPPDPQEIDFQASDGQTLQGRYYPAAVNPSPLVVLMHWVGGDMTDWNEIAVWLQNRGLANPFTNPDTGDWWDPTWFPLVPDEVSYGVFVFSFRDCQPYPAGCADWIPEAWLLDAQAAMLRAMELEGIDPSAIVAIGSSIGADGAANGCTFLNEQVPGACRGAASLGPGDYMGVPYARNVELLGLQEPPAPAWCLVDPLNAFDYSVCSGLAGDHYALREFPSAGHGQTLLREEVTPSAMETLLEFLETAVGP